VVAIRGDGDLDGAHVLEAALVATAANSKELERCGWWRWLAPTTSMPGWTSPMSSARPGITKAAPWSCGAR
jgi:hypothetical protein